MLILKILLFLIPISHAQFEHGNGGGGIKCPKPSPIEILDFATLSSADHARLEFPKASSWKEMARAAIHRLDDLNPKRANQYLEWVESFETEANFVANGELPPSQDIGVIAVPKPCKYVQLALQQEPLTAGDPRFTVDRNLWDQMNDQNKAGLVVHELIWREVRAQGQPLQDARFVRLFNSRLWSRDFSKLSLRGYVSLLMESRLQEAQVQRGIEVALPVCYASSCSDTGPWFVDDTRVREAHVRTQTLTMAWLQEDSVIVHFDEDADFHFLDNGEPSTFDVLGHGGGGGDMWTNFALEYARSASQFFMIFGVSQPDLQPVAMHVRQTQSGNKVIVRAEPRAVLGGSMPEFRAWGQFGATQKFECRSSVEFETQGGLLRCDDKIVAP